MFTTLTGLAALSFSIGGYFMKLSAGLTHLRPTVIMVVFFSIGTVLPGHLPFLFKLDLRLGSKLPSSAKNASCLVVRHSEAVPFH